ncbi:hypothetical protein QAD02_018779 [Eretmocerus hayati]|uniref:Uncharacterized protein n=1 Tax=Eretmocerus hayati TaxID=131215 RepID=A0ACC2PHZ5_9HYME|nr:hypothetical protein QAD02_018779 [Eretmocerus hayati]
MGADLLCKTSNGDLPFHSIFGRYSDPDRAFFLPEIPNAHPVDFAKMQHNPVGIRDYLLFHIACSMGNVKWTKYFLDHGVDPNLRATVFCHDFYAETPLHTALRNRGGSKLEIVKLLPESGANPTAQDDYLLTPLHYMINNGEPEIVDLLMSYGADVNSQDVSLQTPLHTMLENDLDLLDRELKKLIVPLLNYGADINLVNEKGSSPLSSIKVCNEFELFASSIETLMIHSVKLRWIGLLVNEDNKKAFCNLFDKCSNDFQSKLPKLKKQCAKEVKNLQNIRISDNNVTIDRILMQDFNRLPMANANDEFHALVNSNKFQKQFPIYGPMLKMLVKRGQVRRELLEKSLKVFNCFVKNSFPRECSELILQSLSNGDLINLIISKNEIKKSVPETSSDSSVSEQK